MSKSYEYETVQAAIEGGYVKAFPERTIENYRGYDIVTNDPSRYLTDSGYSCNVAVKLHERDEYARPTYRNFGKSVSVPCGNPKAIHKYSYYEMFLQVDFDRAVQEARQYIDSLKSAEPIS
jgi:hypothetical protein